MTKTWKVGNTSISSDKLKNEPRRFKFKCFVCGKAKDSEMGRCEQCQRESCTNCTVKMTEFVRAGVNNFFCQNMSCWKYVNANKIKTWTIKENAKEM